MQLKCDSLVNQHIISVHRAPHTHTGTCQCPPEYLGIDCAVHAPLMNENTEYTGDLGVEEADYYTIQVTKDMIEGGFNLEVVLQKEINSKAYPYLLIREGEIPYANNYTLFDDHDLTANFYHETTHSLLLDTDELSEGTWYLGVLNAESSTENLK